MNRFPEIQLLPKYSVKCIDVLQYDEFRAEHEPKIFPNRFDLIISDALSKAEKDKLESLSENLRDKDELRLGFFYEKEMIGWSYGYQVSDDTFRMATTGIKHDHQRKGLYSAFIKEFLQFLKLEGYQKVVSRHYATDNQIIIPKLRNGFRITGMELTDEFGLLVLVTYHFNQTRIEAMDMRAGLSQPSSAVKSIVRKYR